MLNEVRYNSLRKTNPEHADELLAKNKADAQRRYRQLKRLSLADFSDEVESSAPESAEDTSVGTAAE